MVLIAEFHCTYTIWSYGDGDIRKSNYHFVCSLLKFYTNIRITYLCNIMLASMPLGNVTFKLIICDTFLILVVYKDRGCSMGRSYVYPQTMLMSRNKKNNVDPSEPYCPLYKRCFLGCSLHGRDETIL